MFPSFKEGEENKHGIIMKIIIITITVDKIISML